jgi:hypothetical protein
MYSFKITYNPATKLEGMRKIFLDKKVARH